MAEAAVASTVTLPVTGGWTKHVTCRYFMHGLCKEGDNCRYSHDLTSSKPAAMMCKFFQKGNCVFGERCRFEHCKPTKSEEVSNPQMLLLSSTPPPIDPECSESGPRLKTQDWANAAEFVPGQPYCGRAESVDVEISIPLIEELNGDATTDKEELRKQLCPYAAVGECRYGVNCAYLHGDVCDMCGLQVLHPTDSSQRSEHTKACIEAHEKDMEISFAIQRSKDMMCGVCMEVVFEKANPSERRFGILSNCSHCYCLKCIRKWRSAKQFESKIIKSCPECRITSNFVIPSEYWVEDKEDKQKLIQKYKDGMGRKPCRYFDEGRGICPFGANCFYKHAFPDGRLEEAQPQRRQTGSSSRNRNSRRTQLWDIIDERESTGSLDNDDEEMVTFELSEMLLMLLAAGNDEEVTDSEDEWDLFHEELDDFYEIYL
ncbi:probable E3 ubiquitin-protein ligase makorin-1 [Takifugu rubripes]|uniref:Probable E3 ubiquitin-protein ligase makorin-1 n=1 Tax=Takifugu rubripes TaxID=31033 RepID=MKRN1_TAKRU|nr:probable E3 ubiquitin-protein ligase makorin-1 [Takifugu rubripes]Q5NU14.1 RecName: Full=Probable E3 ubiquitin-protein ligase makorin-1; AltName: Full=RING-type E3 ubiquitin transferase makorin-1 [Takifugu rubripes]BAD80899.1 makorin RING zinc finger protein 1a [Takifugu rubripes]|eukprot:NP_001072050.1 probable E3 ubiquitin-protein ligase makorin-1 [Takifugu rubripes]